MFGVFHVVVVNDNGRSDFDCKSLIDACDKASEFNDDKSMITVHDFNGRLVRWLYHGKVVVF